MIITFGSVAHWLSRYGVCSMHDAVGSILWGIFFCWIFSTYVSVSLLVSFKKYGGPASYY